MKTKKKATKATKTTKGQKATKPALAPAPKVKENTLWNWFRDGVTKALTDWRGQNRIKSLHMVRVENAASVGYPDVEAVYSGTGFVAELKTIARPEEKESTATKRAAGEQWRWSATEAGKKVKVPVLRLSHFTTAQALFLAARWDAGERSWLFVQVGDTRYLVPGNKASHFLKPFIEADLQKAAIETLFGDTPMDYLLAMAGR